MEVGSDTPGNVGGKERVELELSLEEEEEEAAAAIEEAQNEAGRRSSRKVD